MTDHNGVLMMQRALLAGTLGLAMARKAAAILEGEPNQAAPPRPVPDEAARTAPRAKDDSSAQGDSTAQGNSGAQDSSGTPDGAGCLGPQQPGSFRDPQGPEGAVLRAILDAANECLGHFDDRPPGERWCDTLFHLLDLAAFAAELE